MRMVLVTLSVVVLSSCSALSLSPGVAQTGIPDGAPSICGVITILPPGGVLVEEDPATASGSAKAMMRMQASTRVLHRNGSTASYSALAVGQTVSAWFDGPVAESYPLQADAGVVVLEPSNRCN